MNKYFIKKEEMENLLKSERSSIVTFIYTNKRYKPDYEVSFKFKKINYDSLSERLKTKWNKLVDKLINKLKWR